MFVNFYTELKIFFGGKNHDSSSPLDSGANTDLYAEALPPHKAWALYEENS